jgi:hypothetical protein
VTKIYLTYKTASRILNKWKSKFLSNQVTYKTASRILNKWKSKFLSNQTIAAVFGEKFASSPIMHRQRGPLCHQAPQTTAGSTAENSIDGENEDCARSQYEKYRAQITRAIKDSGCNLSATERVLKNAGICCSRRWLKHYAAIWGLKKAGE